MAGCGLTGASASLVVSGAEGAAGERGTPMPSTQNRSVTLQPSGEIGKSLESVLRWVGAVGITLAPLGLFVIPNIMYPEPYETAEEQMRAMTEGAGGGYPALLAQLGGAVFLLVAALGTGGYTITRGRGRTLGAIGLIVGVISAMVLLVVLGFELAMLTVLLSSTDREAAIALNLTLSTGPGYIVILLAGLVGFFLTLPLLACALWRSRVVPIVVPLLFVLPIAIGFVPLPFDTTLTAGLLLLAPCVWMAVQLIRGTSAALLTSHLRHRTSFQS